MAKASRRGGGRVVTARDVAEMAQVSPMTVSRVINGEKNVRASTREAVLNAVRELRYAPNPAARSLASAEHARIGLPYSNPSAAYLSEFLVGILDEVSRFGAQLVLGRCQAGDAAAEREAMRQLLEGGISGLLLTSPLCDSVAVRQEILSADVPIVVIGSDRFKDELSCVRIDEQRAAYDMTRKILTLGHRNIGFISGHPAQSASAARLSGFEAALRELAPDAKSSVTQGFFTYQSGLLAAERLLSANPRPSAIFASNDDMAAAVISVAHRRGLDVPRDLTVMGFDDTAIATTLSPELTTVRQPISEMAAQAVDVLLREIRARRNGEDEPRTDIVTPHTLIERQSSAEYRPRRGLEG